MPLSVNGMGGLLPTGYTLDSPNQLTVFPRNFSVNREDHRNEKH